MRPAATVSLFTATSVVVANMVGTGIFTSTGFQVAALPSPFAILMLWVVGGVAALCGALAYAELAAALPRSGGEYHFLTCIYHPAAGFVAGWTSATVGFAAPVALAAMAFGKYLGGIFPGTAAEPVSLAIVWIITLFHLRDIRTGGAFQNVSTLLKVGLIVALVGAGMAIRHPEPISFLPRTGDFRLLAGSSFAVSLVYVMYAYSGWNSSTYIINEIVDPRRNVPRSLLGGTLLVTLLYAALNVVFLRTTPMPDMAGKLEVGLIAGKHIFGDQGGRIMGGLICIGLVSTISAMTWIGPRVTVAMGEDLVALRRLAWKTKRGVPAAAILFQLAVVTLLLLTSTFEAVIVYIQLSLVLCSFLTVLGVYVLRYRQPELARPYKTWGYPVTPAIFLLISLFILFYVARTNPVESCAGFGTLLLGLAVYYLSPKARYEAI